MRKLLDDFRRIICCWWTCDRIRTSPRDGQLLRIKAGDLLTFGELQAEVFMRSHREDASGHHLRLTCSAPHGTAELTIELDSRGRLLDLIWSHDGQCRQITTDDFQVWPRGR